MNVKKHYKFSFGILIVIIFVCISFSLCCGRFSDVKIIDVVKILLKHIFPDLGIVKTWSDISKNIVLNLRAPRVLAAVIIGASLSVSGIIYQTLFANAIASPDTLGVSQGAAFGAVLGMLFEFNTFATKVISFSIGCLVVMAVYHISKKLCKQNSITVVLVLVGMIMSSFFQALLSALKFTADPTDALPKITYWLMGSLQNIEWDEAITIGLVFVFGCIPLVLLRWRINLLTLSDFEAKSIGININLIRVVCIICATVLTSASVSFTGGISWIGLLVPHITRLLFKNDMRWLLPGSALIGGLLLLITDDVARCISIYEIPISIVTSIIGAPVFFALLFRNKENFR